MRMTQGTIQIDGDDVLEALTEKNRTTYERVLNSDGETLADLLTEYVMVALVGRLQEKPDTD